MNIFYRFSRINLLFDLITLLLSFYVVLEWLPLTTTTPFNKYSLALVCYTGTWVLFSYFFRRYNPQRRRQYFKSTLRLLYVTAINFMIYWLLIHFAFKPFSGYVLLSVTLVVFIVNYLLISVYFAYRFAVEYNELTVDVVKERKDASVRQAAQLDEGSYIHLRRTIRLHSTDQVLSFLEEYINLKSANTFVYISNDTKNLKLIPKYLHSAIIQLEKLNNMQGINEKLAVVNSILPDNGLFVCCFESKSTKKRNILNSFPAGLNYIFYMFYFMYKRVMPKMILTKRLYYIISDGKNRVLTKAEVLGRLYCYGFKVLTEKKVGQVTYVIAQRVKQPAIKQVKIYGPIIRLKRFGKNGIPFEVYKMRTMHPYSEYLQNYIYEKNSLKDGGKFNKDIRVTSMGGFMRKYWLDELPMIFNLLKGDMKLVGVRPLSAQYFSLYSVELQEKRIKQKPGLLPPFYADMPKTMDQIQKSEFDYLNMCDSKGVIRTDLIYFYRIIMNIFFRKARSS